ncbi:MAG: AAA family ATPase [bacterium]|nr:AAA family ATPase [bacterium]
MGPLPDFLTSGTNGRPEESGSKTVGATSSIASSETRSGQDETTSSKPLVSKRRSTSQTNSTSSPSTSSSTPTTPSAFSIKPTTTPTGQGSSPNSAIAIAGGSRRDRIETSALACCLLDPAKFPLLSERVTDQSFRNGLHKAIYQEMVACKEKGVPLDALWAETRYPLEIADLLDNVVVGGAPLEYFVDQLVEMDGKRKLYQMGGSVQDLAKNGSSSEEILSVIASRSTELASQTTTRRLIPIADSLDGVVDEVSEPPDGSGPPGLSSGLATLDMMTAGFHPGEVVVVAARPGCGKTSLALNIAEHVVLNSKRAVAFFSLEMTTESLIMRLLSSVGKVNGQRIRRHDLSEGQLDSVVAAGARLHAAPLHIMDEPSTTHQIRAATVDLLQREKLSLIVIDYLTLIDSCPSERFESRQQEVSTHSRRMKALAKEAGCPILVLAQLRKVPPGSEGRRPTNQDIRDTGAIEQDADVVLLLHPEVDPRVDGETTLIVSKQRNGPTGEFPLVFSKQFTKFREISL